MPLVCLVGRHGSGKSTIGKELALRGYLHLSVGLLRRLANAGEFPVDIPVTLMMAMRRAIPGEALSLELSSKLLKHATSVPNCVIDGFPASTGHLQLLPPNTLIGLVWSPRSVRETRLNHRAQTSQRLWTPGRPSERERSLAAIVAESRRLRSTIFLPNRQDGIESIRSLASRIALCAAENRLASR